MFDPKFLTLGLNSFVFMIMSPSLYRAQRIPGPDAVFSLVERFQENLPSCFELSGRVAAAGRPPFHTTITIHSQGAGAACLTAIQSVRILLRHPDR